MGCHYVAQADLEPLASSHPFTSASHSAGITGMSYHAQPQIAVFNGENGYLERNSGTDMTLTISLQKGGVRVVPDKILCGFFLLQSSTKTLLLKVWSVDQQS